MNSKINPIAAIARPYRPLSTISSARSRDRLAPAQLFQQRSADLSHEIRQYILVNLVYRDDRLGIDALARQFLKSPSSLKKMFKTDFQMPIHEYIVRKRMQLARQLLLQKERSISDIAALTGYADLSNFSRDFKKHFGCSPRNFQKTGGFSKK